MPLARERPGRLSHRARPCGLPIRPFTPPVVAVDAALADDATRASGPSAADRSGTRSCRHRDDRIGRRAAGHQRGGAGLARRAAAALAQAVLLQFTGPSQRWPADASSPSDVDHDVRTSNYLPAIAAAAAIAGDTEGGRGPGSPGGLEIAVRGRGAALAGREFIVIARHIEPSRSRPRGRSGRALRPRPAPSPSRSRARRSRRRRHGLFRPSTTRAAARKSSMRELVHEPMKTRSSDMSTIFSAAQPHVGERALGGLPLVAGGNVGGAAAPGR